MLVHWDSSSPLHKCWGMSRSMQPCVLVFALSITAWTGTVLLFHSSVWVYPFYLFFISLLPIPSNLLHFSLSWRCFSMMGADGNTGLAEAMCDDSVYVHVFVFVFVCVFMKSLCISDWSGSWSGPVRSRDKSPSSVLLNLAHPGGMFCSTSSTGTTGNSF